MGEHLSERSRIDWSLAFLFHAATGCKIGSSVALRRHWRRLFSGNLRCALLEGSLSPVLTSLTHRVRLSATSLLVAAYAFGVLAPALAFSFDRDASIVHSLVEAHGGLLLLHLHHDDTDHQVP